MIQERLKNGGARGELTMIRADGTLFEAEVTTSTYKTRDGAVLTNIVVRDITERLKLQRQVEALNADLSERVRQRTSELEGSQQRVERVCARACSRPAAARLRHQGIQRGA
jgi:hypothetical protein